MTRSDEYFYSLFKAWPDVFKDFANLEIKGDLNFDALSVKKISADLDGFFSSSHPETPNYVVEFHGYWKKGCDVYYQTLLKVGLIGNRMPEKPVHALIVFTHKHFDSKTQPWHEFARLNRAGFHVLYLEDVLETLGRTKPDHPLNYVFTPFLADNQSLKVEVVASYRKLKQVQLPKKVKTALEEIFVGWMMERFKMETKKEAYQMLAEMTPIEETGIYKEILGEGVEIGRKEGRQEGRKEGRQEGRKEGRQEGFEKGIQVLKSAYETGVITKEVCDTLVAQFK